MKNPALIAYDLLRSHLSPMQLREFDEFRRFTVVAADESLWVVYDGDVLGNGEIPYNVECIGGRYAGKSICGYPARWSIDVDGPCPAGDVLLAQLVHLRNPYGLELLIRSAQMMETWKARRQYPIPCGADPQPPAPANIHPADNVIRMAELDRFNAVILNAIPPINLMAGDNVQVRYADVQFVVEIPNMPRA